MRIQETDSILKESRFSRHNAQVHEGGRGLTRAWSSLAGVPGLMAAVAAVGVIAAGVFAAQKYRKNWR